MIPVGLQTRSTSLMGVWIPKRPRQLWFHRLQIWPSRIGFLSRRFPGRIV
jgi:hypothetical protein